MINYTPQSELLNLPLSGNSDFSKLYLDIFSCGTMMTIFLISLNIPQSGKSTRHTMVIRLFFRNVQRDLRNKTHKKKKGVCPRFQLWNQTFSAGQELYKECKEYLEYSKYRIIILGIYGIYSQYLI